MNKKSVISVMVVAMLLTVSLYFVGGTYARYTDTFSGTAEAKIAKWNAVLGDSGEASTVLSGLEWTVEDNEFVAEGVIAPNSSMSAEVELDLTGTQVAVDIFGSVDTSGLAEIIGDSQITVTMTVDGKAVTQEKNPEQPTLTVAEVGTKKHPVKITVSWDNAEDAYNDDDTTLGKGTTKLDLPVSLTVQQHIATE